MIKDTADLVINEILFNPKGEGADYVELYNRSGKTIDLSGLSLASLKETPPNPPDTARISLDAGGFFMLPDSYLVLTNDPEMVLKQFVCENPRNIFKMTGMPAFNNDQGCALLLDSNDRVIDGMLYREDMHHPLLNSFDGVSLERISHARSGYEAGNWYSAAETAGFGTPGYRNSQWVNTWETESAFSVNPELFSPDGDGKDDHLGLQYAFTTPGKLMNILIFNIAGHLARNLVNCGFPGTSGIYTWDGLLDDRTPAPDGIYIIQFEALDLEGRMHRQRKACVVARSR